MRLGRFTRRGLLAAWPLGLARAEPPLGLLCTGATLAAMHDLALRHTAETGQAVRLELASGAHVGRRLSEGARVDVVVSQARQVAAMTGAGLVDGTSIVELGNLLLGLAVRAGAPVPDIATPEALRQVLLAAPGIGFVNPETGPSGVHLRGMLERFGIAEAVADRVVLFPHGVDAVRGAVEGRVALAMALESEIRATPGAMLVGLLPAAVNIATPFAAALTARSGNRAAALALLDRLGGPDGQALLRQAGFRRAEAVGGPARG